MMLGLAGSKFEESRVVLNHPENPQCNQGIAAGTDASVVSELGVGLTQDCNWNHQLLAGVPRLKEALDCPLVVSIPPVEGGDQEAAVRDRTQRRYTVLSTVDERSAGPASAPR